MKNILLSSLILLFLLTLNWSCKKTPDNTPVVPKLIFSNLSVPEGNSPGTKAVIIFHLSEATTNQVTVHWSTVDSTAKAGENYVAVANGLLSFLPGETEKPIEISLISDTIKSADKYFCFKIDSLSNATASVMKGTVTILNDDSYSPPVIPKLTFVNASVDEGNSPGRKAIVSFFLSEATTNTVTASLSTLDGMAIAGQDYSAITDQLITFLPGETAKTIEIPIVSDTILEFNEKFYIVLSNITNATADLLQATVTIMNDDSYTPQQVADGYLTPDYYPSFNLTWSDEFNGSSLDMTTWKYDLGGGGWGNSELEVYTNSNENLFLQNGYLTIRALKNSYSGQYTSARINTKGKKDFLYGRIDIRAKLPQGQGIWPALWMLGSNLSTSGWPACGEIDIMEFLGHDITTVYGSVHYNDGGHQYKTGSHKVSTADNYHDKFHIYTIIWQENLIDFYVDYQKYFSVNPNTVKFDAFNLPQFFIFNVAVGGVWPGNPNASTVFPQDMIVDYVRVFN